MARAKGRTRRKGARRKTGRKTKTRKSGQVPLKILEKRLVKLNRIVASRRGKHF